MPQNDFGIKYVHESEWIVIKILFNIIDTSSKPPAIIIAMSWARFVLQRRFIKIKLATIIRVVITRYKMCSSPKIDGYMCNYTHEFIKSILFCVSVFLM